MRQNIQRMICILLLCICSVSCTTLNDKSTWTHIRVGKSNKTTVLKQFGEPESKFIEPKGYGAKLPWEIWNYKGGVELWFRDSVVEQLFLPKYLDPLLRDGRTVKQMLSDYGFPEIVYESYDETKEGNGITGWSFIYPSRGDEFIISSWFPILPGRNRPPPPTLELMGRYQWSPDSVNGWLDANDERRVKALGETRIEDIHEYFARMDANASFRNPVAPGLQPPSP